jgi:hypothetical protein
VPKETPLTIEQILTMLPSAPRRIAAATRGATPVQLCSDPAPGEWSARDILAHLRSCSDVWGKAIARILDEDRPKFAAVNPRGYVKKTDYLTLEFKPSLRAYTKQRAELVTVLQSLPRKAWSRSATVTGAGKALERTVLYYADWIARHERAHLKQIERAVEAVRAI